MSEQISLDFDGKTYNRKLDGERLGAQLLAVRSLMLDGKWRTLKEISEVLAKPQASVSARLRDLRKPKFGNYLVERRARGDRASGLFEYRVVKP
jgi:hypothetical protein